MNYSLAKKLKDAEFLQRGLDGKLYQIKEKYKNSDIVKEMELTFPTLSELIEACGKRFFGLFKCDAHIEEGYFFSRRRRHTILREVITIQGDTPEEAVSLLWLKLQEK